MNDPTLSNQVFWVVRAPNGDRPYVSIRKPESYLEHLERSGEKAEVYKVYVELPLEDEGELVGVSIEGLSPVSCVKRVR